MILIIVLFFQTNPCQHPIVILRDISEADLKSLLKFMYHGEVQVNWLQQYIIHINCSMIFLMIIAQKGISNS